MINHTFAVCAYKESPYLEKCIRSLKHQTLKSRILISTSTPNEYISSIAEKYNIPVFVNPGESGITQDWNYSVSQADTDYVTIAHQDDVYDKKYLETIMSMVNYCKNPLILFSDYYEIRDNKKVKTNRNLKIKRIMLSPLRIRAFQRSRWVRRRILSMGSPICCPAVTFAVNNLPEVLFENEFRACEDWQAWEKFSRFKGEFCYSPKQLMGHRIHEESETTATIQENKRSQEEYKMFCKFWPKPIAKFIGKIYATGQNSNEV